MPSEQPCAITLVSIGDMYAAMEEALTEANGGVAVSDACVRMAVAHSAFETGFWHVMRNYNIGNEKSLIGDAYDWTLYPCGEEFTLASAEGYKARDPDHVTIVSTYKNGAVEMASVNFTPPNPVCRFRSFASLAEGVRVYVAAFRHSFARAWAPLLAGNAVAFIIALKACGYFTLDEATYQSRYLSVLAVVDKTLNANPPPPRPAPSQPVPPSQVPAPPPQCSSWVIATDPAATAIAVSISERNTPAEWVAGESYETLINDVPWKFMMVSENGRHAVTTWKCNDPLPGAALGADVPPPPSFS